MNDERELYIIFKAGDYVRAFHPASIQRGLYDWSAGREVLGMLHDAREGTVDIWSAPLTYHEAALINNNQMEAPLPKLL